MIQPTIHVAIARPVEKSKACLTAITPAIRDHIEAPNAMRPPKKGIKESILNTPGELEKPIVRSNSPHVADVSGPLNNLVQII